MCSARSSCRLAAHPGAVAATPGPSSSQVYRSWSEPHCERRAERSLAIQVPRYSAFGLVISLGTVIVVCKIRETR